jgi:hypothetical protein
LNRVLLLLLFLLAASLTLPSCGSSSSPGTKSGLANRAFFTEDVSAGTISAGVYIVDAQNDVRAAVSPIGAGNAPGMMVLTPNRTQTLVFSSDENLLTIINNAPESVAGNLTLPGFTESFVVSPDSNTAYVAVPTARVVGQSPGAIEVISLVTGAVTAEISCFVQNPPGTTCLPLVHTYQYLSISHSGNRILAFSGEYNSVFVITPTNVGTQTSPIVEVTGFDHPVTAFFSGDDTTAYVVNCGAECGGTQASVQKLDLTSNTPGVAVSVPAASVAMLNGTTMYLAGTPVPASPCTGQTTAATTCGLLTVFDISSMTATKSGIVITDGYHNHMALGANGQLFIGARTCTEITPLNASNEVRGCLSIYNTESSAVGSVHPGAVVIPQANGDVTGIQPIAKRTVVYVVQNGSLAIYDTTTDALEINRNNPNNPGQISNLVGQFVDVKTVDF